MARRRSKKTNTNNSNQRRTVRGGRATGLGYDERVTIASGSTALGGAGSDPASGSKIPSSPQPEENSKPEALAPIISGGRQTQPVNVNPLGLLSYNFLPRRQWQQTDLSQLNNNPGLGAQQLLEMFADLSPEVSLALWNETRMINTGWKYKVMSTDGKRELPEAKARLDSLVNRINNDSGGMNALIDSWSSTAYLQGAIAGEIALTEDLQDIEDIYSVQPWTIHFMRDGDQKLVPFQQQVTAIHETAASKAGFGVAGYPFVRLNPTTFGYIPIDAPPDDPYGRPPAAPVLQLIGFDLQLLKDIRQSVHMNAFGRLHVKVIEASLLASAPPGIKQDPSSAKAAAYVNAKLASFVEAYNRLKPDDTFVSTDSVSLESVDFSGKTFQVDVIVRMLERRLIRALKQLPVLMGSNEGTTETHGTVQMDIYAAGIKSLQGRIASLISKLLTVALQVYGIAGQVLWEFEAPRANDRMKDTQADAAEAQLSAFLRDQGWITQDDASIRVTGSKAVADPKPTPVPPSFGAGTSDSNNPADDGTNNEDGSDKKDPATDPTTSNSSKPKPDAADEGQNEETDNTTTSSTSKKGKGKGK